MLFSDYFGNYSGMDWYATNLSVYVSDPNSYILKKRVTGVQPYVVHYTPQKTNFNDNTKKTLDNFVTAIMDSERHLALAALVNDHNEVDFLVEISYTPCSDKSKSIVDVRIICNPARGVSIDDIQELVAEFKCKNLYCNSLTCKSKDMIFTPDVIGNTQSLTIFSEDCKAVENIKIRGEFIKDIRLSLGELNNVVSLDSAFGSNNCNHSIMSIDLRGTTFNNVTSISHLCVDSSIMSADDILKGINCENISDMSLAFAENELLSSFDLTKFGNKLRYLQGAFTGCTKLKDIKIDWHKLSEVHNLHQFLHKTAIEGTIHISGVNFKNLKNVDNCFSETFIEHVIVENCTFNNLESAKAVFASCDKLKSVTLKNCSFPKLADIKSLFYSCDSLEAINVDDITKKSLGIQLKKCLERTFSSCILLEKVDLSYMTLAINCNIKSIFDSCERLADVKMPKFSDKEYIYENLRGKESFGIDNVQVENAFSHCTSLKKLEMNDFKSLTTSLNDMFSHCKSLEEIHIDNWYVPHVVKVDRMFTSCTSIKELKIHNWIIATDFHSLNVERWASCCDSLRIVDVDIFDGDISLTDMDYMFDDCPELRVLNLNETRQKASGRSHALFAIDLTRSTKLEKVYAPYVEEDRIHIDLCTTPNIKEIVVNSKGHKVRMAIVRDILD